MQPHISARQGFTLLELLIVTVIMMVVVGGSLAAFATFQDRQKALVTAKAVQQLMRTAQTKARVRETPAGCPSLTGYQVTVNSTNARLYPVCGTTLGTNATEILNQRVTFDGVTVTPAADTIFVFRTLEGGVTSNAGITPTPIAITTLTFTSSGITGPTMYQFTVSPFGAISQVFVAGGAQDL